MRYSPSTGGFYPEDKNYGSDLPKDLIEVSDELYRDLIAGNGAGRIITAGENGVPHLADPAPPTPGKIREMAEVQKSKLRAEADAEIAWRQDAVDASMATEEETTALAEWKKYRILLMRVDTANPEWPGSPGM